MHRVGQDLADYAGKSVANIRISKLQSMFSEAVERKIAEENYNEEHEDDRFTNVDKIRHAGKLLSRYLEKEAENVNGNTPVTSVFDALQITKSKKEARTDIGIRALLGHLESAWKKDRSAMVSASSFMKLRDHYVRNYPKSKVGDVIDEIGNKGYMSLPTSDLMQVAAQINSQEDYDELMVELGLNGKHPNQVKARRFILAVVNGDKDYIDSMEEPSLSAQ